MIDINKQLAKVNITVQKHGNVLTFIKEGKEILIDQKELEQYLFICLLEYVEQV